MGQAPGKTDRKDCDTALCLWDRESGLVDSIARSPGNPAPNPLWNGVIVSRFSSKSPEEEVRNRCGLSLALIAVLTFLGASPAWAARTDVVHLKNGDRVTCNVKELDRGKLRVTTDHMGTIYIDWFHIQSIEAARTYEVELESGEKYYGDLAPGSDESKLAVQAGDTGNDVTLAKIVHVTEIKRGFFERLDGSIDFGMNFQKTDQDVNYSFTGEVTHRTKNNEAGLDYRSIFSNRDGVARAFRNVLDATYTHFLKGRWHAMGLGKAEQNDELGLDLRTNLGATVGRQVFQTNQSRLSVTGGLNANREQYILDPEHHTSLEAIIMTSYDFFIHGDLGADLSTTLTVLPSLTEDGRYRLELDARYRHEIVMDLFVSFSGWYSFDNQAPVSVEETFRQTDYGLVTSVGWMF